MLGYLGGARPFRFPRQKVMLVNPSGLPHQFIELALEPVPLTPSPFPSALSMSQAT